MKPDIKYCKQIGKNTNILIQHFFKLQLLIRHINLSLISRFAKVFVIVVAVFDFVF